MFSRFRATYRPSTRDPNAALIIVDMLNYHDIAHLRLLGGDQPELEIKFETNMSQIIMQVADPTNPDVLAAHNRKPHSFQ